MNLGIVFGGKSVEHDISIISYFQVLNSIDIKKYNIYPFYLNKNNEITYSKDYFDINTFKENKKVKYKNVVFYKKNNKTYFKIGIEKVNIDMFLVIVHGKCLEDGVISSLFEYLNIPYSSPDYGLSYLLHDKYYLKLILKDMNIKVIDGKDYNKNNMIEYVNSNKLMKCSLLGSSIGIYRVDSNEDLKEGFNYCFKFDERVVLEEKIKNLVEFTQAGYMKDKSVVLSDIEEIRVNNDIYSFDGKYNNKEVERVIPAKIDSNLEAEINDTTKKIISKLLITSIIRIDYIYDLDSLNLYVNEINVIPGGLSYYLFESKGIYFKDVIDDIINNSFKRHYFKNEKISSFKSSVLQKRNVNKMK